MRHVAYPYLQPWSRRVAGSLLADEKRLPAFRHPGKRPPSPANFEKPLKVCEHGLQKRAEVRVTRLIMGWRGMNVKTGISLGAGRLKCKLCRSRRQGLTPPAHGKRLGRRSRVVQCLNGEELRSKMVISTRRPPEKAHTKVSTKNRTTPLSRQ